MPLVIGCSKTHPGERRLSVVPDVVKKYQGLGASVVMQKDAAKGAHFRDTDFADVTWVDSAADVVAAADVVLCVQPPAAETLAAMKPGSVLCGMLQPWYSAERVQRSWKARSPPSRSSCCRISRRAWTSCPARARSPATNVR